MIRPFDIIFAISRFRFWRVGLRHQTLPTPGGDVHYWRGGEGSPVLLVHGLGGSAYQDFRSLAGLLIKSHQVISLDLPGFGQSHKVSFSQSVSSQAGFLLEFLDYLKLGKIHLLGNSMGGWIALKFAEKNPDRVRRMVLTASAGIRFEPPPLEVFTPADEEGMIRLLGYLLRTPRKLPGWFLRDWLRVSRLRRAAVKSMLASMQTEKDLMDEEARKIQIPTLILWGAHDRIIPLETGRRLASLMPRAKLKIFEENAHLLLHEASAAANRMIKEWFAEMDENHGDAEKRRRPFKV